jgi:hypothetical protein
METNVADERRQFVRDFESGHWSMTELCERFGVTRPTGYKWVARHRAGGDPGLVVGLLVIDLRPACRRHGLLVARDGFAANELGECGRFGSIRSDS